MRKITRFLVPVFCICALFILFGTTAQAKFDKKKAKKNIKVVYKELDDGILATYENNNKFAVKIKAAISYTDFGGTPIQKEVKLNNCLGKGRTMALFFKKPTNGSGEVVSYSFVKKSFTVAKSLYKDKTKKIKVTTQPELVECKCLVQNLTGKELLGINLTFVFYDSRNRIVAVQEASPGCTMPSKAAELVLNYTVAAVPERVEIYKNWGYCR